MLGESLAHEISCPKEKSSESGLKSLWLCPLALTKRILISIIITLQAGRKLLRTGYRTPEIGMEKHQLKVVMRSEN